MLFVLLCTVPFCENFESIALYSTIVFSPEWRLYNFSVAFLFLLLCCMFTKWYTDNLFGKMVMFFFRDKKIWYSFGGMMMMMMDSQTLLQFIVSGLFSVVITVFDGIRDAWTRKTPPYPPTPSPSFQQEVFRKKKVFSVFKHLIFTAILFPCSLV